MKRYSVIFLTETGALKTYSHERFHSARMQADALSEIHRAPSDRPNDLTWVVDARLQQ